MLSISVNFISKWIKTILAASGIDNSKFQVFNTRATR
jgi:hypothetical protein